MSSEGVKVYKDCAPHDANVEIDWVKREATGRWGGSYMRTKLMLSCSAIRSLSSARQLRVPFPSLLLSLPSAKLEGVEQVHAQ